MENRLQHIFLKLTGICIFSVLLPFNLAQGSEAEPSRISSSPITSSSYNSPEEEFSGEIDTEFFELGVFAGFINIEDFTSEEVYGVRSAFHATEDIFLEFNYATASVSKSSFEKKTNSLTDERDYNYYDFLFGYKIFPGEVFPSTTSSLISSFHLVAGVGHTEFGGEENFTYVLGLGYRVAVTQQLVWNLDIRNYIYNSNLTKDDGSVHNIDFTSGISYLF